MALFLVQHGKSLSKELDLEQGLSEEGTAEVKRIADVAKLYAVQPNQIRHSVKKRARQTAEIFSAALNPDGGVREVTGIKAMDDVLPVAANLDPADHLMLVGHLPFMERLTALLVAGDKELTVFKFQNGGVVCLDRDSEARGWYIKWGLMPNVT